MKHKKFMDIERLNTNFVEGFRTGDEIYIEEKIDGANAAIRYDSETDTVICQSRKKILDEENNLRGFYCCSPRKIRKTQKCGITRN